MIEIQNSKFKVRNLLLGLGIMLSLLLTASAQKRDNLTDKEDLQVREAQELDLRMKVFVKIIDRRFLALTDTNAAQNKQVQKDIDEWGDLRVGTSQELYWDIQKTIDEAILKLDDAAERDQKNPLFGRAVHILADACQKWVPQLKPAMEKTSDEKEKGLIGAAVDYCAQVIEASAKVPKEEKKKKNN